MYFGCMLLNTNCYHSDAFGLAMLFVAICSQQANINYSDKIVIYY